jgi:hypothetical protein
MPGWTGAGQYWVSGSEFDRAAKFRKSIHEQDTAERRLSGRQRSGLRGQHRRDGTHVPQSVEEVRAQPQSSSYFASRSRA